MRPSYLIGSIITISKVHGPAVQLGKEARCCTCSGPPQVSFARASVASLLLEKSPADKKQYLSLLRAPWNQSSCTRRPDFRRHAWSESTTDLSVRLLAKIAQFPPRSGCPRSTCTCVTPGQMRFSVRVSGNSILPRGNSGTGNKALSDANNDALKTPNDRRTFAKAMRKTPTPFIKMYKELQNFTLLQENRLFTLQGFSTLPHSLNRLKRIHTGKVRCNITTTSIFYFWKTLMHLIRRKRNIVKIQDL